MKKTLFTALVIGGCLLATPGAYAANVDIGVSIGIPGVVVGPTWYPPYPGYQRPIVVAPPPIYVERFNSHRPGWKGRGHYKPGHRGHWKSPKGHHGHHGHRR